MDKIENFFHFIAPKIISLTNERFENTKEIKYKDKDVDINFATEGDWDNEKLIIEEISKWFSKDTIISEETLFDGRISNSQNTWIIEPICGSSNFKNGIRFFCTNIAVAKNGELIAACVVDHSRGDYIWSIGEKKIYINHTLFNAKKDHKGIMIETDLSGLIGASKETLLKHERLISYLLHKKNYYLSSFCTSLPFACTALGRIDAYANGFSKLWDQAAANFLVLQAGGVISETNGNPWTLSSDNVLATLDKNLHEELLKIMES